MSRKFSIRSAFSNPRLLWIRYALALSIVTGLLITSHLFSIYAYSTADEDAQHVNLSASQVAESARILYLSSQIFIEHEQSTERLLREATDRFAAAHETLTTAEDAPEAARDIYFSGADGPSLDILSSVLVRDAYALLDPNAKDREWRLYRMTSLVRGILHRKLEDAAEAFEQDAIANFERIEAISKYTFAAALFALLIEAVFIFYPAQRVVSQALRTLEERNDELQSTQDSLRHEALHDQLTNLANRRYLMNFFQEIEESAAAPAPIALLHIDLDRFKQINDTMGHDAGDFVLRHVADTLRDVVAADDFIARIGGDEFIVVSRSGGDAIDVDRTSALAQVLIQRLSEPVRFDGKDCHLGASIGIDIAEMEREGRQRSTNRMLENADIALYHAKRQGRGRFAFYNAEFRHRLEVEKSCFEELLPALRNGEIVPFYQPQVDAATGAVHGVEALARWRHPQKGVLAPAQFLEVATERGLAAEIDDVILRRALEDLRRWDALGLKVPHVAVNVSAHRIADPDLIDKLAAHDIPHGRLAFEVLETVFLDQLTDTLKHNIDQLDELGVRIELDDFGTGHASLVSFLALSPHTIKIARELAAQAPYSEKHRRLVSAVVGTATALGIETTIEGVETAEQGRFLAEMGCTTLQGYFFAKPLPADKLIELLSRDDPWPEWTASEPSRRAGA